MLSCAEYPSSILSHLHALYKTGTLCDVTLVADDDSCYRVHSLVLMCSSSYFRMMTNVHNHYTIKSKLHIVIGVPLCFVQ